MQRHFAVSVWVLFRTSAATVPPRIPLWDWRGGRVTYSETLRSADK
jgi:hypothetical protein